MALGKQWRLGFTPEIGESYESHLKCQECFLIDQAFAYRSWVELGFSTEPRRFEQIHFGTLKIQLQDGIVISVQFSRSVVSDSLRLHESQHARPPCPSQTAGVYSNSCPSSW